MQQLKNSYSILKVAKLNLILLTVIFILNAGYLWAEVSAQINPHNYDNKDYCQSCHVVSEMPRLNYDSITTCVKCHPGSIGNHPVSRHPVLVKVPYNIVLPEWMPLSKEEKIVCFTCHDNHNRSGFSRMLRIDYESLCVSCHINK